MSITDPHLDFYFWLAFLFGMGGFIVGCMCLWKLQRLTEAWDNRYDDLAKVAHDTHTLVNANMGAQLKISAVALRRIAEFTGNQADLSAAELAEKLLDEHTFKQGRVDRGL